MKQSKLQRVIRVVCTVSVFSLSTQAMSAAFQLWEQDGASVGNYHAGYAALANDASIAFYNPAGITRIKNQQLVIAGNSVLTDFKYKGTLSSNMFNNNNDIYTVTAQGGAYGFVPALHYAAPITDYLGFGFSVDVPFGLKTDYGTSTPLRYAATETSVTVIDISPSLGFRITDNASIGAGFDVQRMAAEFDAIAAANFPSGDNASTDTLATNRANDTAYGYHLGALYEFNSDARVGVSYHSRVVHHLNGSSRFDGPLGANPDIPDQTSGVVSSHASTKTTLPAYTALSGYYRFHPQVAVMGTVIYTQWNVFKQIAMSNVSGVDAATGLTTTDLEVVMPQYYRNTWNASVGADYYVCDQLTLRAGVGFDQSPVRDKYRDVRLPDNDRYVIALGGHYQATKAIGLDLGWSHFFMFGQTDINPPPQVMGLEQVTTHGKVTGGADAYGMQLTWDIT